MKATQRTLILFLLMVLTLAVLAGSSADAAFYQWINPNGGDWCEGDNWDYPGFPSLFFDFALFDLDAAYEVVAQDPSGVQRVGGVIVDAGIVTLHTHDSFDAVLSIGRGSAPASLFLWGGIESAAPMMIGAQGTVTLNDGARLTSRAVDSYGFSIEPGGVLGGDGVLDGQLLRNMGTVSPGTDAFPAGKLIIGETAPGGYDQRESAHLFIRLDGAGACGQLRVVDGSRGVTINGTLEITTAANVVPAPGDRYEVLTAPAYDGEFQTVVFPEITDRDFELIYEPTAVVVAVSGPSETVLSLDIQPGSCPNPLSTAKRGILTAAILGTETCDLRDIDVGSVRLEGVAPVRHGFRDAGGPSGEEPCLCLPVVKDGIEDLTLKFPAAELIAALGPVIDREERRLTLTGNFLDGTAFRAEDCVLILAGGGNRGKGRTTNAAGSTIISGEMEMRPASAPSDGAQWIAYTLPDAAPVRLTVFDVAGRPVTTLVQEAQPAGSHRVQWDAASQPSGVYFYRLATPNRVVTARAVLIR